MNKDYEFVLLALVWIIFLVLFVAAVRYGKKCENNYSYYHHAVAMYKVATFLGMCLIGLGALILKITTL